MNYLLYFAYHALLLSAAIAGAYRSRFAVVLFIAGTIPLALLTDLLVPAADLAWYRATFDELEPDNVVLFALANDFEAGWAIAVVAVKLLLPRGIATLGTASLLLLLLPLLLRGVRTRIEYLSLLLIFPGSFLILFNTLRQGMSEYLLLASMLSGSFRFALFSGLVHRFGWIIAILWRLARKFSPVLLLVPSLIGVALFWDLLDIISPDNGMRGIYEQLDANYVSFAAKIVLYSLPYVVARALRTVARRRRSVADGGDDTGWSVANGTFLTVIGITLISVIVHPRLADRIAFYLLPVSVWALASSGGSRWLRASFYAAVFALGIGSLLLASHREFFDDATVVTDQLEHDE